MAEWCPRCDLELDEDLIIEEAVENEATVIAALGLTGVVARGRALQKADEVEAERVSLLERQNVAFRRALKQIADHVPGEVKIEQQGKPTKSNVITFKLKISSDVDIRAAARDALENGPK